MAFNAPAGIRRWVAWSRTTRGALVAHPLALGALALLIVNDHLLKQLAPGLITGKASDVAGLIFFPVLLVSLAELLRPRLVSKRSVIAALACLVTAVVFALVKTVPAATDFFNGGLGNAQWLLGLGPLVGKSPVAAASVTDPTDLLALPAVVLAFLLVTPATSLDASSRRVSPVALAILMVAGLASAATSPAMRSSSISYEEDLQLTRDAPAIARHVLVDITNRDQQLASIDLLSDTYSMSGNTRSKTPGVLLSLVPDEPRGLVQAGWNYSVPNLTLTEACRESCSLGATVVVRLEDADLAANGPVTTHLEVTLMAGASEEGTGEVDIDLGLRNDAENAFAGAPVTLVESHSGSFHVGSDVTEFAEHYRITIDGSVLAEPFGFPLIGQIEVGATGERSVGHPNAHSTEFDFRSAAMPEPDYPYWSTGILYDEPPWNEPTIVDLLPLCEAAIRCVIEANLTSYYEEYVNDPPASGATPPPRSIDLDWYLEVRIEAFDGRPLPDGAITIERVD